MLRRSWLVVLAAAVLMMGCRGDDVDSRPTDIPLIATATQTGVGPASAATATVQPGYVASPRPLPGRSAADVVAGQLAFTQIRVNADPVNGAFALHANVKNTGAEFLNDVSFHWRITGPAGAVLDRGSATIASLAPGETTSVEIAGSAQHVDSWTVVEFEFIGTAQ